jgi:Ulp1 family protease
LCEKFVLTFDSLHDGQPNESKFSFMKNALWDLVKKITFLHLLIKQANSDNCGIFALLNAKCFIEGGCLVFDVTGIPS